MVIDRRSLLKYAGLVVVDVHNDTDTPELIHWHGQMISSEVDGAAEEGTLFHCHHQLHMDFGFMALFNYA